jgi:hypothetical protein
LWQVKGIEKGLGELQMKRILVLGGLFLSVAAWSQTIINTTHYNISGYSFKCCADLKIGSCLIFISETNNVLDFGLVGCSKEIDKGISYSILIKKNTSFEESEMIIAHELVHIGQMKSGRLVFNKDTIIFDNKIYPNDVHVHANDAHEIQAISTGILLYEKYKDVLYDFAQGTDD